MPAADLHIHDNQVARTTMIDGISVRNDVLFTNDKGEDKRQIQKPQRESAAKTGPCTEARAPAD